MNRRQLVEAIVACEATAKEFRAALGAEALADWTEQETAPTYRMPGVTVSCSVTHPSVSVHDEKAFVEWVRERYPTEVETITRARPAWAGPFLAAVAERGDPPCTDEGEVIPGLTWSPGGAFRSLSILPSAELKGRLTLAAKDMVAGRRPLALPQGDDDATP